MAQRAPPLPSFIVRRSDLNMRIVEFAGNRVTSEAACWIEYLAAVQPDGSEYFGRNIAAFRDAVT